MEKTTTLKQNKTYNKCIILLALLMCTTVFSQTVTKTYDPGFSTSIDGVGNFGTALPNVTFSAADFPDGDQISDVNVSITWAKTDGSCDAPGNGNSHHQEVSFRIDAPTATQVILANQGTWSGNDDISKRTTDFDQSAAGIPSGVPTSGTFLPNDGNLDNFNTQSPFGNWSLSAGDNGTGDPMCLESYSVTITAVDLTDPVINCPMEFEVSSPYTMLDYTSNVTDNISSGANLTVVQVPAAGTVITGSQIIDVTINSSDIAGNNATECTFKIAVGTTLGLEDNSFAEELKIHPNPTSGKLTIDISDNIQLTEVKIYDISGRVVKIKNMSNINTYNLDISDLTSGIYFLHVQSSDQKVAVKRIIKK